MSDIGHNMPPAREMHAMDIEDLFVEAQNFLDGSGVNSEQEAEGVALVLEKARLARKAADESRKAEKAPHDAAAKAVQEAYVPLLTKCDQIAAVCKEALTPWQIKKDAEQRAIADKAREEAAERVRQAREARQATAGDDLAARAAAEALQADADRAVKTAARLDKAKPQVAGGSRAIGLRTSNRIELTDPTAFARWAWANRRDALVELLGELASREGPGAASIPGITVHTERKAA